VKVPYSWLTRYCDPEIGPGELAERLAMTGTEVERVSGGGPADASGFVVGRTVEVEPHPDADRLSVCQAKGSAPSSAGRPTWQPARP
jgi:phenylalanyl-tRNA synthetase beta chain